MVSYVEDLTGSRVSFWSVQRMDRNFVDMVGEPWGLRMITLKNVDLHCSQLAGRHEGEG